MTDNTQRLPRHLAWLKDAKAIGRAIQKDAERLRKERVRRTGRYG